MVSGQGGFVMELEQAVLEREKEGGVLRWVEKKSREGESGATCGEIGKGARIPVQKGWLRLGGMDGGLASASSFPLAVLQYVLDGQYFRF